MFKFTKLSSSFDKAMSGLDKTMENLEKGMQDLGESISQTFKDLDDQFSESSLQTEHLKIKVINQAVTIDGDLQYLTLNGKAIIIKGKLV